MTEHTPKPRKPREIRKKIRLNDTAHYSCAIGTKSKLMVGTGWIGLKEAKRLHTWLGRAIAWMEAQK